MAQEHAREHRTEHAPEKWDGRRTHIVDRAADYVALHAQGLTVAQIARRRRRSKGYVSILLRLGQVLAGLPAGEVAAYRSPRITWALAQRLVRADTPAVEVRAQLRYALGGFSTHNVDRRRRGLRAGTAAGTAGAAKSGAATRPSTVASPLPGSMPTGGVPTGGAPTGGAASAPAGMLAGWGFDQALFDADAAAFARAHLERLAAVHQAVARRTARAVQQQAAGRLAVGQSLRHLSRQLSGQLSRPVGSSPREAQAPAHASTDGPPGIGLATRASGMLDAAPPDQRAALAAFAVFEAGLMAAVRGALAALDEAAQEAGDAATAVKHAPAVGAARRPAGAVRPASAPSPPEITPDEWDAELAD